MNTIEHLEWRYAVKKFDPKRRIPRPEFHEILEVLRLAPSSFGLQPWKFVIVEDPEIRKKIQPAAWNQAQVAEASHLIVLCTPHSLEPAYIQGYVRHAAETRGVAPDSMAGYEKVMLEFVRKLSVGELAEWMKNQVYLALGMLLAECARRKIDTCPMEGFAPEKVDAILGLPAQGLRSIVLCPVGYRAADDKHASLKKVRFDPERVFLFL